MSVHPNCSNAFSGEDHLRTTSHVFAGAAWSDDCAAQQILSYEEVSLPINECLVLACEENIWNGEFVDVINLPHKEPQPFRKIWDYI